MMLRYGIGLQRYHIPGLWALTQQSFAEKPENVLNLVRYY